MKIGERSVCAAVTITIFFAICLQLLHTPAPKHPDAGLNIDKLVRKYGYPLQIHNVTTEDGYILTLHRIPHGRNPSRNGIPALFLHGLTHSAADYTLLGPDNSLSFLLADKGYDVWLANARGTTWSRKHTTLDPDKDREFWDFTLHEIGVYDTGALIDYVLETTKRDKLHYVGYSQGVATICILAAEKPHYANKIRLVTALAPAVLLKDCGSHLLQLIIYFRETIQFILESFFFGELFAFDGVGSAYLNYVCQENSIFINLCLHSFFLVQGYDYDHFNKTNLPVITSNFPAGMSSKQFMHVVQIMESGRFHQYVYDLEENLRRYGQETPPAYNLSKLTAPIALYFSSNDMLVNIKNMEALKESLPNVVKSYRVSSEKLNHDGFMHGDNVTDLYNAVIEEILKY